MQSMTTTPNRGIRSTPHTVLVATAAAARANVPLLLWGDPGEGKTAKLTADFAKWGFHPEVVNSSNRDNTDYLGLPVERDGQVHYSSFAWARRLADAPRGVLIADEFNCAEADVMKAQLRVIQERWVGEFKLPDSVAVVAIANPPSIAVDGIDLPAPIANRFMHVDWTTDLDDWFDGVLTDFRFYEPQPIDSLLGEGSEADKARVRGAVIAFLKSNPGMVKKIPTDPTLAGRAWPSKRSWTNAMAVLGELQPEDEDTALVVLAGCVGDAAAIEYMSWLQSQDLYDPQEVLANPNLPDYRNDRADRLFALMSSIRAYVQVRGDKATWQKGLAVLTACASGGKPDVAMPGARELLNSIPQGASIPQATRAAFTDLFNRSGRWAA